MKNAKSIFFGLCAIFFLVILSCQKKNKPFEQEPLSEQVTTKVNVIKIYKCEDLYLMNNSSSNDLFELANSIDCGAFADFRPIQNFQGTFVGNNFTIRNLSIRTPHVVSLGGVTEYYAGLFTDLTGAGSFKPTIGHVRFDRAYIVSPASGYVGVLAGRADRAIIQAVHVGNSTILAQEEPSAVWTRTMGSFGGIVGYMISSDFLFNSVAGASIFGALNTGGLVGLYASETIADANVDKNTVSNSKIQSKVSTGDFIKSVGGLFGRFSRNNFKDSYAKDITFEVDDFWARVGGLIGISNQIIIQRSYATAQMKTPQGSPSVGSLIGEALGYDQIFNSYVPSSSLPFPIIGINASSSVLDNVRYLLPEHLLTPASFHTWDFIITWKFQMGQWPTLYTWWVPFVPAY